MINKVLIKDVWIPMKEKSLRLYLFRDGFLIIKITCKDFIVCAIS